MESLMFNFLSIVLIIPMINSIVRPQPFQLNADKNKWSMPIIILTRSFQHFTLYSQLYVLYALWALEPTSMFIGKTLSWTVFFAYYGINHVNPMYLAYHPEELVKQVTAYKPPCSRLLIGWIGLHIQHMLFPFYLQYISVKYGINTEMSLSVFINNYIVILIYILWHLICWHVQEIPAYPFLINLRTYEYEILFYNFGILVITLVSYGLLIIDRWNMQQFHHDYQYPLL
jgi:hypothetical protein